MAAFGFAAAAGLPWWLSGSVGWPGSDRPLVVLVTGSNLLAALSLAVTAVAVAAVASTSAGRAGPALLTLAVTVCWGHLAAAGTARIVLVAVGSEHAEAGLIAFGVALYALVQVIYARRNATASIKAEQKTSDELIEFDELTVHGQMASSPGERALCDRRPPPPRGRLKAHAACAGLAACVFATVAALSWWVQTGGPVGRPAGDRLGVVLATSSITLGALSLAIVAVASAAVFVTGRDWGLFTAAVTVCRLHLAAAVTTVVVLVAVRADHTGAGLIALALALYPLAQAVCARRDAHRYLTASRDWFDEPMATAPRPPATTDPAANRLPGPWQLSVDHARDHPHPTRPQEQAE